MGFLAGSLARLLTPAAPLLLPLLPTDSKAGCGAAQLTIAHSLQLYRGYTQFN